MQNQAHIGILFLSFSLNNIHFLLTDCTGQIKSWTTARKSRSKGAKKNLPLSSFELIKFLEKKTKDLNYAFLHVRIKGWGHNKKNVFKILKQSRLKFISVIDTTTCPHNGCRIPRKRKL
uniref:Ribosomal protein S11 n=2 Tax=Bangiaceae TaxID=31345 RepID=H3JS69_PYRHA|nr:ribosomal protein S11 [Neoporphyra haitanensis]AFH57664.1 ribosomal protein S11 [Neoporphyra haitanensis]QYA17628.1 ribosomal protein S11 [Porphyra crispata]BAL63267.1 ribosomal protein S11 [Neoporphyra haitanensis]